jgi:restriction system protein
MARARFTKYVNPVISALRELGGSARPNEVSEIIARDLVLPDSVLDETNPSGVPRFYNDVAWARFYLAKDGFIDSSRHGVWTLTEKGRSAPAFTDQDLTDLIRRVQASKSRAKPDATSCSSSTGTAPTGRAGARRAGAAAGRSSTARRSSA